MVTWWSGHSTTSGNWTVTWFGGWELLWDFHILGTALRFLGTGYFFRIPRQWYLQRCTWFWWSVCKFGDGGLSNCWPLTGMRMGSRLSLMHAGSLLFLRCLLFLLRTFPSSVLTSNDLTSTWRSTPALNHLPDLSAGFTCTISPWLRGGSSFALMF